jgi:hypothetical protein
MTPARIRLRTALFVVAALASLAAAFWVGRTTGYRAALDDTRPEHRFLVVVTPAQGSSRSSSNSFTHHYNIRDRGDAAKLAKEAERLKALGVEYYIAKGQVETTIRPEPDLRRVNTHR